MYSLLMTFLMIYFSVIFILVEFVDLGTPGDFNGII